MARPRITDKKHKYVLTDGSVTVHTAADLGKEIRAKRVAAHLTLNEAAPLCKVGVRFLTELEGGKPGVQLGKVLQVMQTLGLDLQVVLRTKEDVV